MTRDTEWNIALNEVWLLSSYIWEIRNLFQFTCNTVLSVFSSVFSKPPSSVELTRYFDLFLLLNWSGAIELFFFLFIGFFCKKTEKHPNWEVSRWNTLHFRVAWFEVLDIPSVAFLIFKNCIHCSIPPRLLLLSFIASRKTLVCWIVSHR